MASLSCRTWSNIWNRHSMAGIISLWKKLQKKQPSVMFTLTPAFPPHPRPRFFAPGLRSPAITTTDRSELDNKDLVTPYVRQRSFLIDVINSTARPRFAQPTPHPTSHIPHALRMTSKNAIPCQQVHLASPAARSLRMMR